MAVKREIVASLVGYALVAAACVGTLMVVEPVTVSGGSMAPTLHPGDIALVRRGVRASQGDVALIRESGHSAVLHRVVAVRSDGSLRTRGDANPIADFEPVASRCVAGRVMAVIPAGSLMRRWRGGLRSAKLPAQSDSTK